MFLILYFVPQVVPNLDVFLSFQEFLRMLVTSQSGGQWLPSGLWLIYFFLVCVTFIMFTVKKKTVVFTGKRWQLWLPENSCKKYSSTVDNFTDTICKLIYSE